MYSSGVPSSCPYHTVGYFTIISAILTVVRVHEGRVLKCYIWESQHSKQPKRHSPMSRENKNAERNWKRISWNYKCLESVVNRILTWTNTCNTRLESCTKEYWLEQQYQITNYGSMATLQAWLATNFCHHDEWSANLQTSASPVSQILSLNTEMPKSSAHNRAQQMLNGTLSRKCGKMRK